MLMNHKINCFFYFFFFFISWFFPALIVWWHTTTFQDKDKGMINGGFQEIGLTDRAGQGEQSIAGKSYGYVNGSNGVVAVASAEANGPPLKQVTAITRAAGKQSEKKLGRNHQLLIIGLTRTWKTMKAAEAAADHQIAIATHGPVRWSSCCRASPCRSDWATCGAFRTRPTRTAAAHSSSLTWSYCCSSADRFTSWKWLWDSSPATDPSNCGRPCPSSKVAGRYHSSLSFADTRRRKHAQFEIIHYLKITVFFQYAKCHN